MIGHLNQSWHILSQYNDISNPLAHVLSFKDVRVCYIFSDLCVCLGSPNVDMHTGCPNPKKSSIIKLCHLRYLKKLFLTHPFPQFMTTINWDIVKKIWWFFFFSMHLLYVMNLKFLTNFISISSRIPLWYKFQP